MLFSTMLIATTPDGNKKNKYSAILGDSEVAVEQGIKKLHDQVNATSSPDERNIQGFVTSSEVVTFKQIPKAVDAEIKDIRKKIKTIILMAATDIEQSGSSGSVTFRKGELDYLPKDAKAKYQRLMDAKKLNNISVRSVNLAIKMLSQLNQKLIDAAKQEKQIDRRNKLFITQAAYVYEMADIVLDILDRIGLEGKKDIQALHQEYKNKVTKRGQNINKELEKISQAEEKRGITKTYAESLRESYKHMQRANEIGLTAWKDVMDKVQQQDSWLNKMKQMRETIALKRNAAKLQLETLRDMGVLRNTVNIIDNMEELVTTVGSMELLILDESTVRQLIFGDPRLEGSDL